MKKILAIIALLITIGFSDALAQSTRINFIRYKKIEYSNYSSKWQQWPVAWNESGAYAIIKRVYDETYKVSIYSYNDEFLVSSTCTFDPGTTSQKRQSEGKQYLNCYVDPENDQVWTSYVSLESLLNDATDWRNHEAQLYLWLFSGSTPTGYLFE